MLTQSKPLYSDRFPCFGEAPIYPTSRRMFISREIGCLSRRASIFHDRWRRGSIDLVRLREKDDFYEHIKETYRRKINELLSVRNGEAPETR